MAVLDIPESRTERLIQVAVTVESDGTQTELTVDPWGNCPSAIARNEGRSCEVCPFWGGEVTCIDWIEFSVCLFSDGSDTDE